MKKALVYAATAILLGTVTMVAPLMLLKPTYYRVITSGNGENLRKGSPAFLEALDEGEARARIEAIEALEKATSPSILSSAGFLLIPSFLLALGVFAYAKKRIF